MNILVTGGAGYVGSHTVRRLLAAGHDAWVYDNLSYGHRAAVPAERLLVGDLADRSRLETVLRLKEIDAVVHFAGLIFVGESVLAPADYYRVNVGGSLSLLEAMRAAQVERLVFSSTTAVYGEPQRLPIAEDQPTEPINPYGYTKLVVEKMLDHFADAYGLRFAALRYFNAAGAAPDGAIGEDHRPETHLIPLVLQVALGQRSHIAIFGDDYATPDGTCVRDYVHVDDLADAHLRALERLDPGARFKLNLGVGRGYSVREVIETCRQVTGEEIPALVGPRRAGDAPELVADSSAARAALGWSPQYCDLAAIIETAWRWHRTRPHGYADRAETIEPALTAR